MLPIETWTYDGDSEMGNAITVMVNTDRARRAIHPGGYWCSTRRPCPQCRGPIAAYRLAARPLSRLLIRASIHIQSSILRRRDRRAASRIH